MTDAEVDRCRHDGALLRSIVGDQVELKKRGRVWVGLCPFHTEKSDSLTVYDDGHFHCYGCGAHGSVFDFVMRRDKVEFPEAARRVAAEIGVVPPGPKAKPKNKAAAGKGGNGSHKGEIWQPIVPPPADAPPPTEAQLRCDRLHEYRDAGGQVLFYVRRHEAKGDKGKQFYPLTFGTLNGKTGWHPRGPNKPKPLYGLDRLAQAPDAVVLLVEGEKSADAAQRLFPDTVAMSWMGGANADGGADLAPLAGRNMIVWGDADAVGNEAVERLLKRLPAAHWVYTADLPDGYDAADLAADGCADPVAWLADRERAREREKEPEPDEVKPEPEPGPDPDPEPEPDGEVPPPDEGPDPDWDQEAGPEGEVPPPDGDAGDAAGEAEAEANIAVIPPDDVLNAIAEVGPDITVRMLVALFNRRFSVALEGNKMLVIWSAFDPVLQRYRIERTSFEEFRKAFNNRRITVSVKIAGGGSENVTKSFANWWLDDPGRCQYLGGVVFAPGAGPIPHMLNLWRDWAVTAAPGDWSLMAAHIHHVICGGREEITRYVIRWLAHMVQHPDKPGEVAIVMRGLKGVGKGVFGKWVLRLCGQHGLHIIAATHLTGRFMGHLRDVIFVFADEALYAGDKQHEGILKGIITEHTLLIEPKYLTPVMAANLLHILMSSNNDWVVPATHDERRYLMLDVLATHIGDFGYFAALNDQMENGGLAAMLYDLQTMDLGDFHPRRVPDTEELGEQKLHSHDSVHRWWMAVLSRGFVWKSRYGHREFLQWDEFVTTELLCHSYAQWCQENRINYPASRIAIGKMLTAIYPYSRPRKLHPVYEADSVDHNAPQPVVKMPNQMGYRVGTIDNARALFRDAIKLAAGAAEWDRPVSDC